MPGIGRRNLLKVTEHQEECLNILQEEAAEVIQAASKIKRFGILNRKPGAELNNLQNLELEIGDVLAMIELCKQAGIGLTDEGLERAKQDKFARLSEHMHTWAETNRVEI
jgi:NTP pyrophosphatase (non-canonical NTP hydrolase)